MKTRQEKRTRDRIEREGLANRAWLLNPHIHQFVFGNLEGLLRQLAKNGQSFSIERSGQYIDGSQIIDINLK